MYTVYAIYNRKHQKIYIGQTQDLIERLRMHNSKVLKGFTAQYDGHWELIYEEAAGTRKLALTREKQLKSYRGRQFVKQFIRA